MQRLSDITYILLILTSAAELISTETQHQSPGGAIRCHGNRQSASAAELSAVGCRRSKSRDKRLSGSNEGHGERDLGMSLGERRHSEGRRRRADTERTETTPTTTDVTLETTQLFDNEWHTNETGDIVYDSANVINDWLATWSYVRENSERLVLYSVIAVCLGFIAVLLAVIFYLICCRTRSRRRHRVLRSSTTNSDEKFSSRNLLSSTSTQTSPENQSLLPPDSPDKTWVRSPTPAVGSPNRASPRLMADPSSSPSTLRSLPTRVHSGPSTVGDDLIWKTLERQRSRSPNAGLYTNPYRHDTFRTIDSRSSKSPRK